MNSLNKNLKTGDKIVMQGSSASWEVSSEMFGSKTFTSGTALGIMPVGGLPGDSFKVSAMEIDADKTMERHAEENGWNARAASLEEIDNQTP